MKDPLIGRRLGQYQITREIGRGGMGVVYEATHIVIGQRAAVKTLSVTLAQDAHRLERFFREARASSLIEHAGIPKVFDYGRLDDDTPYILMEFLKGEVLRARLMRSPGHRLDLVDATRITRQIASALRAVHEQGIIHRDLKPENVILVSDSEAIGGERAKILDFGIAKFLQDPVASDQSLGTIIGTPAYMSPEQCLGEGLLDTRVDVYALGIMFYEMLCGEPPFTGIAEALFRRQLFEHAVPAHQRVPNLPDSVSTLIGHMLAKPAALRPSIVEVYAALSEKSAPSSSVPMVVAAIPAHLISMPTQSVDSLPPSAALDAPTPTPSAIGEKPSKGRVDLPARPARPALLRVGAVALAAGLVAIAGGFQYVRSIRQESRMVTVPAGQFTMGSSPDEVETAFGWARRIGCVDCTRELFLREAPPHVVTLSQFRMDATEVTNQQFAVWLNRQKNLRIEAERRIFSGSVLLADLWAGYGYSGINHTGNNFTPRKGMEQKPVALVSWDAARLYCRSLGKRLPTEAEWEYAARGPDGFRFPWGDNEPSCSGVVYGRGEGGVCAGISSGTQDVGSAPQDRSSLGIYDLGGNVAEWVLDRFYAPYPGCGAPCQDPRYGGHTAESSDAELRVVRGGAWFRKADSCRAASRSRRRPEELSGDIGFRCVTAGSTR